MRHALLSARSHARHDDDDDDDGEDDDDPCWPRPVPRCKRQNESTEQVIETKQPNLSDAALTGCGRNTKLTQLEGSENTKLPYAARATAEDTQLPDARSFQKVGQEKVVSWVATQLASVNHHFRLVHRLF